MIVACTGVQKALLREEFPSLTFIELRGYEIRYDKNRALTILRLLTEIPKILIRIKREKAWLGHFAAREGLDLVISDNRYGLTIPGIPCIFITHQLLIKTPFGAWADRILQALNYRIIRRFSRCWIPDIVSHGLAGDLSHPRRMPTVPTRYIGWLSRFDAPAGRDPAGSSAPLLVALLSGPEPQRTLLEKDIFRQAQAMADKSPQCRLVIVRGLPGGSDRPSAARSSSDPAAASPASLAASEPAGHLASASQAPSLPYWVTIHNHLPAKALEPLLDAASVVLARPGYSTVMDLERLGKRALFIPTPGQTEQEYLGPYLAAKGWATCVDQRVFSLATALELAAKASSTRERQAEDPSLLPAEIEYMLSQSCPPALG